MVQRRADMTIASKGGGLIVKDGLLAANCECCDEGCPLPSEKLEDAAQQMVSAGSATLVSTSLSATGNQSPNSPLSYVSTMGSLVHFRREYTFTGFPSGIDPGGQFFFFTSVPVTENLYVDLNALFPRIELDIFLGPSFPRARFRVSVAVEEAGAVDDVAVYVLACRSEVLAAGINNLTLSVGGVDNNQFVYICETDPAAFRLPILFSFEYTRVAASHRIFSGSLDGTDPFAIKGD